MDYSPCMIVQLQNGPISRIFSGFWSVFFADDFLVIFRKDFDMFFLILIFHPK